MTLTAPSEIEKTLSSIWESLEGTKETAKKGGGKMRASLFNLILITQNNARSAYIHGIAQSVIEKFPSRILFVSIDKQTTESLFRTKVSVLNPADSNSDIACDLIEFEVGERDIERVSFALLPHILPDLPIYVVWAEDPTQENALMCQLEKFATRLIFDSESTDDLPLFAKTILKHHTQALCEIADLNWARTENWRFLLFSIFSCNERLAELKDAKSLQLIFNAQETQFFCHTRIQSIYLQGWLACQLQWKLESFLASKEGLQFIYRKQDAQSVHVCLTPKSLPQFAPGAIASFDLITRADRQFSFQRNLATTHQATIKISSKEQCAMPTQFIFSKGKIGQSLAKEICQRGTSQHYLHLLHFISNIGDLSEC